MLKRKKRHTQSTNSPMGGLTISRSHSQADYESFISSVNIHSLPLIKFILCLCEQKYSVLGDAPIEILTQAWNTIYEEYIHMLEDAEQIRIMTISKEINLLETNYGMVELIVKRLTIEHSDEIVEILKRTILVRTSLKPGPNYLNELNAVMSAASTWLVQIADKKKELAEAMPKGGTGTVDRKYFDKLITSVSKHMHFRINKNEISTAEFASYVRDMRETYEQISAQNQKAA